MALQTYIADGFMEDCEELIHTLTEKFPKVDWHKFCFYWKEMQFDLLFYGRQSGPEMVEFTEELLQVARLYMVTETDNFEDQIVGLFIAYAITVIQPYKNLCALRIIPKDVAALKKIEDVARREKRNDILMILGRLYLCGKAQFHVSLREQAMDVSIRKYFDGTTNVPKCIARRWHGILDRTRVKALEEISKTEYDYMALKRKAKLAAEAVFPGTIMKTDMFKPEAKKMADSLRKLISGQNNSRPEDNDSYVNILKQKAMKRTVDTMKHLHTLTDRQNDIEKKVYPSKTNAKTKAKSKRSKLSSPDRIEEPAQESKFSLPSLDDFDPPENNIREGSPEPPFKGFTALEIKLSKNKALIEHRDHTTDARPTNVSDKNCKMSVQLPTDKTKSQAAKVNNKSPSGSGLKRNNSPSDVEAAKKRKKLKNKFNRKLKLTNDFNSDSDTSSSEDGSDESDDSFDKKDKNALEANDSNTEVYTGKELTIQSKGVTKHYVDFDMNDLVIRLEKDAPPEKDIEIDYIDNYKGNNALYEEICEVSDNEEPRTGTESMRGKTTSLDNVNKMAEEDDMEVCQVYTTDSATETRQKKNKKAKKSRHRDKNLQRSFSSIDADDPNVDDTLLKILNKDYCNRKIERRRLKQPNLRSKLKKMGLLPVANFEDETT